MKLGLQLARKGPRACPWPTPALLSFAPSRTRKVKGGKGKGRTQGKEKFRKTGVRLPTRGVGARESSGHAGQGGHFWRDPHLLRDGSDRGVPGRLEAPGLDTVLSQFPLMVDLTLASDIMPENERGQDHLAIPTPAYPPSPQG